MSIPSLIHKYRFEALSGTQEESIRKEMKEKPSPIFLYGVENSQEMGWLIEKVANGNEYTYKTVQGKQTIINIVTKEVYKKSMGSNKSSKIDSSHFSIDGR